MDHIMKIERLIAIRGEFKTKNVTKSGKSPQLFGLFEFGKNLKFDNPPPSYLIWEKSEIGKIFNFGNPPWEK